MNARLSKLVFSFAAFAVFATTVSAQVQPGQTAAPAPTQASAPAWSPAQSIDMFAFPKNGQSADQQLKDESECYGMAKQRTSVDPTKPAPQGPSPEEIAAAQEEAADNAKQVYGTRVRGAARGAAGGAAIGAIAGDAGTGAAAGAVAGTMRGGMSQRQANAQSKQQAAAQAAAALKKQTEELQREHQEGIDTFQRAFAACMDSRNYSVK
jgi:Glycine-zipper domain